MILYADEFFFLPSLQVKRIWTHLKRPRVKRVGRRGAKYRVALFAGLATNGRVTLHICRRANQTEFLLWIKKIVDIYSACDLIYIILDNASYHSLGLSRKGGYIPFPQIKLIGLPKYCPKLNLAEQLGRILKRELSYIYRTKAEDIIKALEPYDGQYYPKIVKKVQEKYL